MADSLKDYRQKRNFKQTNEPEGKIDELYDNPIFVIEKHDASSLHYDFRLQIGGVLKSWAVPKGPSTDPSEKRLAIRTEDHPLAYANFEGQIPEEEYGGGTVMIWDRGRFHPKEGEKHDELGGRLEEGHLMVFLEGQKLSGGYDLTRIEKEGDDEKWLLVKTDDEQADARRNPVSTENKSVVSGQSIEQIREKAKEDE